MHIPALPARHIPTEAPGPPLSCRAMVGGRFGLTDHGTSAELDPRRQRGFIDFVIVASVLVVDDDTTVAEVVVGYLQRAGHAVIAVADGPAALGAVRDAPPD